MLKLKIEKADISNKYKRKHKVKRNGDSQKRFGHRKNTTSSNKIKDTPIDVSYGKNAENVKELRQFHKFVRAKRNRYLIEDKGNIIIYERPLSKDIVFMEEENKD